MDFKRKLIRARCDASIRNNKRGIGFIIHDLNDEVIYEHYEEVYINYDITQLELYSLYRCLCELKQRNIDKVKIRSDSKSAINALRGLHIESKLTLLLEKIKKNVEPEFNRIKYKWLPRTANVEADRLAKMATK